MADSESGWNDVDALIDDRLVQPDKALSGCLERSRSAGLPDISVSPSQGKFLQMLVTVSGARRVLEIGTLGGFWTIFMARGVPADGMVVSLEANPDYVAVARENIAAAGQADKVEVIEGRALENLPGLEEPFDFHFIDADKVSNCDYVDHAVRLSSPGALIVVDNVVRAGAILAPKADDVMSIGTRRLYDHVSGHPMLDATAIQTVGAKGWDGMLVARVLQPS
ncbi:MAG: O-methyltransferase [Novosphingobium sp.]|nr:O-methyltransferase [Novosphingobium sp.]